MSGDTDSFLHGTFPPGFKWATATASYQIEGAWDKDEKGISIWDTFSHMPGNVANGDTGDTACDSYHKYQEDIELMKKLGLTTYRFSISWCRIFPDGTKASMNQKGIDFYSKFIDALLLAGIEPMVTLYHWDLPQPLQDIGGWPNAALAQHFLVYADQCFESFGDRVKMWITFNEPICTCYLGYAVGIHAPGIKDPTDSPFRAGHTIIRAHAITYRLYESKYKPVQKGLCGITINCDWEEPKDPNSVADREAAEKLLQCKLGWFANPIYGDGDYPEIMKKQMFEACRVLDLPKSPLPEFTEDEKKINKGAADFFGLNYYTTRLVTPGILNQETMWTGLSGVKEHTDRNWDRGASEWLYIVPWGLRKLLNWVKKSYNNPLLYITENGISDNTGTLEDTQRINYYKAHINQVLKAVKLDGCNVQGYTAWSLLDNFEWAAGYKERFGLHKVDFTDPNRPRVAKQSANFYATVIKNNGFPAEHESQL